ncbi:hypothetical protein A6U89_31785 [Agrobacterium sp. B133/95]|nr:hypothetical protein A6U89_31785 [Agrobacterium sp. B133/95]
MPDVGPQVDTTHLPSSLNTTLCTLIPGPGDHFDFVRMPAHSRVIANGLLTTQSEEDPVKVPNDNRKRLEKIIISVFDAQISDVALDWIGLSMINPR